MAAVQQRGNALEYASPELKNDKEVVMAAVQQDGEAFQHASPELQNDEDIIVSSVLQIRGLPKIDLLLDQQCTPASILPYFFEAQAIGKSGSICTTLRVGVPCSAY